MLFFIYVISLKRVESHKVTFLFTWNLMLNVLVGVFQKSVCPKGVPWMWGGISHLVYKSICVSWALWGRMVPGMGPWTSLCLWRKGLPSCGFGTMLSFVWAYLIFKINFGIWLKWGRTKKHFWWALTFVCKNVIVQRVELYLKTNGWVRREAELGNTEHFRISWVHALRWFLFD